jgi:hypothetical protein
VSNSPPVAEPPPSDGPPPVKDLPSVAAFLGLGTSIAVCVGLGLYLGILADNAWSIAPWGLLGGLVLGAAIAVQSVVTLVRRWL